MLAVIHSLFIIITFCTCRNSTAIAVCPNFLAKNLDESRCNFRLIDLHSDPFLVKRAAVITSAMSRDMQGGLWSQHDKNGL